MPPADLGPRIPKERFDEVNTQKMQAIERATAAEAARLAAEQALAAERARYTQELAFVELAATAPNLRHDSVKRLFRDGHAEYTARETAAGRQPQPFADWMRSDTVKADPVYGVHLSPPTPVTPAAPASPLVSPPTTATPAPPVAAPPDPNRGATTTPAPHAASYRPEDIATAARSPSVFQQHAASIRQQLEQQLGVKLGSAPPKFAAPKQ